MSTIVQRLRDLVATRGDDDTLLTRLLFEAALEIENLQAHIATAHAERDAMVSHCRAIENTLKVGCVEDAAEAIERLKGENKTLRETPVGVAATQYHRMADERAYYAQECARLRAKIITKLSSGGGTLSNKTTEAESHRPLE